MISFRRNKETTPLKSEKPAGFNVRFGEPVNLNRNEFFPSVTEIVRTDQDIRTYLVTASGQRRLLTFTSLNNNS